MRGVLVTHMELDHCPISKLLKLDYYPVTYGIPNPAKYGYTLIFRRTSDYPPLDMPQASRVCTGPGTREYNYLREQIALVIIHS